MKIVSKRIVMLLIACCALASAGCAPCAAISTKVQAFYYPWYRNMITDGNWFHWEDATHVPPDDLPAAFYPQLGAYSANDPAALRQHMKWLVDAGVGVIISSWWGQGSREDYAASQILDIANTYGVKVCFHMEPYAPRTAVSVTDDVRYIIGRYGSKPAFFRDSGMGNRPVFYFFAAGDTSDSVWAAAWDSIRGTAYDSVVIMDSFDHNRILSGHWDGFYNYFPGIDSTTWNSHASWANTNNKIFVPPVGAGWDSTQVGGYGPAPIARNRGQYYDACWSSAWAAAKSYTSVRYVAITSFNEWHEGTQIEPAVPKTIPTRTYVDYVPDIPQFYIDKTASWAAVCDAANSGKVQCEDYSGGTSAVEGIDYHDTTSGNSGGKYRSHNVDIQDCAEGGYNVGWIAAGEWLRYTNVQVAQSGEQEIRVRASAWNAAERVSVCDGSLANVLLTLTIPVTGGFQNWRTISGFVPMTAGAHTIYLYAETGDFNLNWFEIRRNIYRPDVPSGAGVADVTPNSTRWTWQDNSNNETGFQIYADPGAGPPTTLRATTAADATYWDYTGLTGNTRYCFQVAATNANGSSAKTQTITCYTLPYPPPGPVTNFTVTAGDQQNTLDWTNPATPGFVGTKILFKIGDYPSGPTDETAIVIYDDAGTSCVHAGLTNGVTYYYSAFAHDSVPNYSAAANANGTPEYIPPPGPVTNFKAYGGNGKVDLSWTNPTDPGLAGVKIIYKTTGFPISPTDGDVAYDALGTGCVHTGLTNGTKYYYVAYAYTGPTSYSGPAQVPAHAAADATIPEAKALANSQMRAVRGNVVTAVFSGNFYVQAENEPYALKVTATETPSIGWKVDLVGMMAGLPGSERSLNLSGNAIRVTDAGPITITPAALNNKAVGGAALNSYTPGVVNGVGVNNIGLLVRVCGKVVSRDEAGGSFQIDDGSGPIKVYGVVSQPTGQPYVVVTGVVSRDASGIAAVRPRYQTDILEL